MPAVFNNYVTLYLTVPQNLSLGGWGKNDSTAHRDPPPVEQRPSGSETGLI